MTEVERIVSRAKRGRAVFVGVITLLCIAGAFVVVDIGQESRIANVERSSCVKDPAGKSCQRVKRQSDRNRSIADTCIAFWKVGYPCPKPGTGRSIAGPQGGDAPQPASAGQQPAPAPAGDTGGTKPPKSGSGRGPAPHNPTGDEPSAPPESSPPMPPSPAPTSESPAPTSPAPAAQTPSPGVEPEPPGLLTPALTKVCSVADELAHLC